MYEALTATSSVSCLSKLARNSLVRGARSFGSTVPVVAVASDQQQVLGWPEFAKGYVEADAVFTQTRTLVLGS